jgi:hypothetical protein
MSDWNAYCAAVHAAMNEYRARENQAIETACQLAFSVSGWNRYVRVNDYVVDTITKRIVATAWPRSERGAFPVRNRGDTIEEAL